ncbi:uncharacterized protein LY89DRAFT_183245 [Mollisia scopiformis]|uniref:2EXR domain-containing protein n=1 Tax=Mollisia scopiformis TaxID=149040 RepID=A0A194XUT4_MOLSC|nr:uncharacterized protein LY89DRAFT_183245 [Mollisia scopiformis]KUJ23467.1 hypothetical protein LY89DRAFT_183245 [Mollisia scopiformis]
MRTSYSTMEKHTPYHGSIPATIFTCFLQLPLEMRREIWRQTIPTLPRFIPHSPHQQLARADPDRGIYFCINRESRSVYLEIYTSITSQLRISSIRGGLESTSPHANLEHDILYLRHDAYIGKLLQCKFKPEMMDGIRHVAIEEELFRECIPDFWGDILLAFDFVKYIHSFERLDTLTIVEIDHVVKMSLNGDLIAYYVELEKQRNLAGREMAFMGCEGKTEIMSWWTKMLEKSPDWKAPDLRFMRIGPTLKAPS